MSSRRIHSFDYNRAAIWQRLKVCMNEHDFHKIFMNRKSSLVFCGMLSRRKIFSQRNVKMPRAFGMIWSFGGEIFESLKCWENLRFFSGIRKNFKSLPFAIDLSQYMFLSFSLSRSILECQEWISKRRKGLFINWLIN